MLTPTRTAAAGKFQSKSGEDFISFVDNAGNVLAWLDSEGICWCENYCTTGGISIISLQQQVNNLIAQSGLVPGPNVAAFIHIGPNAPVSTDPYIVAPTLSGAVDVGTF